MSAWKTSSSRNEKQTVLIVSQDKNMATVWGSLFKQRDYHVIYESSACHALQSAHSICPVLTIVDLNLTRSERLSLCKKLRPTTCGALFLLDSNEDKNETADYYCAGVDERLSARISPAELLAKSMFWLRSIPRGKMAQVYA